MAPPSGPDQLSPQLANFEYLHQPGSQQPVEYIPVDDFFDQYLELLNFSEDGGPAAGMAKGARVNAAELPEEEIGEAHASCSLDFDPSYVTNCLGWRRIWGVITTCVHAPRRTGQTDVAFRDM